MYKSIAEKWDLINYSVIQERYASFAGTFLGTLWALISPITQIIIYYFIVKVVFSSSKIAGFDPFITIVIGIMHYSILNDIVGNCTNAVLNRCSVLLQVKIEPAVFIAIEYLKSLIRGAEYLLVVFIVYLFYFPGFDTRLLVYPFLILVLYASLWGPGLALSVANVYFRDTSYLVRVVLNMFIYLNPIIYHFTFVPEKYWQFYFINPYAGIFAFIQWSLLGGLMPPLWSLVWSISICTVIGFICQNLYKKSLSGLAKRF